MPQRSSRKKPGMKRNAPKKRKPTPAQKKRAVEQKKKEKLRAKKLAAKQKKEQKPKRARSAYTFFVAENRAKIQAQHSDWSFQQFGRALGEAWKNCRNKGHYEKLALADKKRAERERAAYKASKPKRALSAYMFFVQDHRENIVRQNPNLSFAEVGRALGQAWAQCSASAKEKYEHLAAADKKRAEREREVMSRKI